MRFIVPQFIDHEAKIVWIFTFNQFLLFAGSVAICFFLRFMVSFEIFIAACVILVGGSLALIFIKVGGRPLPTVLGNFFKFGLMPKMYIWKKKETPVTVFKKEGKFESQLKKLKNNVETTIKK